MILGNDDDFLDEYLRSPSTGTNKSSVPARCQSSEKKSEENFADSHLGNRTHADLDGFFEVPIEADQGFCESEKTLTDCCVVLQVPDIRGTFILHPIFDFEPKAQHNGFYLKLKPEARLLGGTDTISIKELAKLRSKTGCSNLTSAHKFTVFSSVNGMMQEAKRSFGQVQRLRKNLTKDLPFTVIPHLPALRGSALADLSNLELFLKKLVAHPCIKRATKDSTSFALSDFLNPAIKIVGGLHEGRVRHG